MVALGTAGAVTRFGAVTTFAHVRASSLAIKAVALFEGGAEGAGVDILLGQKERNSEKEIER